MSQFGGGLLLAYWALLLPGLAEQVADALQQYASLATTTQRVTEILHVPDELPAGPASPSGTQEANLDGVSIELHDVTVTLAGQSVLRSVNLRVPRGMHVAIVGASGAGKSTLAGLLLGFFRPAAGAVLVDGERLEGRVLDEVRSRTAWVDPSVRLWNRSLLDNIAYGAGAKPGLPMSEVIGRTSLGEVIARLPEGLQTRLGEGGALLSGGEGQRVRLARSFLQDRRQLAILDEPFRGLARADRGRLLLESRERWRSATLLCITHDISETLDFDYVVVVHAGEIVEQGSPTVLAQGAASRYRALLDGEESAHRTMAEIGWRRMTIAEGKLSESGTGAD